MTIDVSTPAARRAILNTWSDEPVARCLEAAFKRIEEQEAALAECYRQSGADPDDNEDWRLAMGAVQEVTRMRKELDATDDRVLELEDWYKAMKDTADAALDRCQSRQRRVEELGALATDLAGFIDATHCSHPCCQDDPFVKGALALLDRARSAGVLP